jgi:very-short-patch-repair endonuclease
MNKLNKNELFISKAEKIHGNRYDYSKVNYINAKTYVTIICKDHGEFEQTPSNHLSRFNCQKCSNNLKSNTNLFINKAKQIHGQLYEYCKVKYVNADTPVTIICKEHGEFEQIPDFHINRKCKCPKCAKNVSSNINDFIKKSNDIHKNKYDYSCVDYINSFTPVKIICKNHGEFEQTPDVHLNKKCGCPYCINKTEFKFFEKIKEIYTSIKRQYKVEWCKNKTYMPYDFVIEELNIIIELDGEQHFKQISNWTSPDIQLKKDIYKMNCANNNGFSVIRILQIDVAKDNFDWVSEIQENILKIVTSKRQQNLFICKNNEYSNHINLV